MKRDLLLILVVTLSSSWTWGILSANPLVGVALFLLSFLILIFVTGNYLFLSRKLYQVVFFITIVFISVYLMLISFDKQLFQISQIQATQIRERQGFYVSELGRLYGNRYGIYYFDIIRPSVNKYIDNVASLVDINALFFPIDESNKSQTRIPLFFFPFMIVGLFVLLSKLNKQFVLAMCLIFIINGFLNTTNTSGPLLIYPVVVASIGAGFVKLFNLLS